MVAPPIAAFAEDEDFWRLNMLILRNTSIINFLDRCAITLPILRRATAPVGLMIVGGHGEDRRLLVAGARHRGGDRARSPALKRKSAGATASALSVG